MTSLGDGAANAPASDVSATDFSPLSLCSCSVLDLQSGVVERSHASARTTNRFFFLLAAGRAVATPACSQSNRISTYRITTNRINASYRISTYPIESTPIVTNQHQSNRINTYRIESEPIVSNQHLS